LPRHYPDDNAECINEALEGIDWALHECIEQSGEINTAGKASLIQARKTIDRLLEAVESIGK
jgi:hypothetical protein